MIAALDVHYDEDTSAAVGAAVVFARWEDAVAVSDYTAGCGKVQTYVPGEFFQRELPCLLAVLREVVEPLDCIVVDGYVRLGDKPGLGMHLWEALGETTPIVGVAKTRFHAADAAEVFRGASKVPLYITAVGVDLAKAVANVQRMAGSFRLPTMLKQVDQLARGRPRLRPD